jgi:hypothetical protein
MTPELYQTINHLPEKENEYIKRIVAILGIVDDLVYVDVIPDSDSTFGECCPNVLRKVEQKSGEVVYGWKFYEFSYMIEAEFHAIWKSPNGKFIDITPSAVPSTTKILFGIDRNKKFDGSRIDNYRLNTTDNELVDDIIEIEKAKFKFIDTAQNVDNNGFVLMNAHEQKIWQLLYEFSFEVDQLFAFNGTVNSDCFCGSSNSYENCHRDKLKQFLKTF